MEPRPTRVLLVEDNPADARLLREALEGAGAQRFQLDHALRLSEAREKLAQVNYDLILLDLSLPDAQGLDTVVQVHACARTVPIVVMTGNDDETLALEALRVGVQDFLIKGAADGPALRRTLEYSRERKRAEETLARQAREARLVHRAAALAAETSNFEDALDRILGMVCETVDCPVGHVYLPIARGSRELKPVDIWHIDDPQYRELRDATLGLHFPPGVGMPGCMRLAAEAMWLPSLLQNESFPLAPLCRRLGLWSALGFPIKIGGEMIALLEFFSTRELPPDRDLMPVLRSVGEQLSRVFERKRAEEAIRASEERYRRLFEGATDAVVTMDANGVVRGWNAKAAEVFGWRADEIIGRTVAETIVPPEHRRAHQQGLQRYVALGESKLHGQRIEIEAIRRDDRRIPIELAITTVPLEGQPWFTAFARDISERRRSEEALEEHGRLSTFLADVGVSVTRDGALGEILTACAEAAVRHLRVATVRIWTMNDAETHLEQEAYAGPQAGRAAAPQRIALGETRIGRLARQGLAHLTNDALADGDTESAEWAREERLVGFAGYPLLFRDRPQGVLAVYSRHALNDATLEALASAADVIALGIQSHRGESRGETKPAKRSDRPGRKQPITAAPVSAG